MKEENLYLILEDYLKKNGYYPVKVTPLIKIRGYRPDVTGLKGKEVQCIEVKREINERSILEAVVQARIYMFGATHVFVAFTKPEKEREKKLLKLLETLCEKDGIGIYLINTESKTVEKILDAKFSKYLCLSDYDDVLQQLEEREFLRLENTYPEYVRDICIYLSKKTKESVTKKDLIDELKKSFTPKYWLYKSGARGPKPREAKAKNRIEKTLEGAIQLGFIIERKGELKLSYNGYLLSRLSDGQLDPSEPRELNEKERAFLTGYLLRYPVFKKSIEILSKVKGFMILGISMCKYCKYKSYKIKDFKISDNKLLCPKCGKPVKISLLHKLKLEYGIDGYYPIIFTKGVHNKPLIFEFKRKRISIGGGGNVDAIRLKK